MNSEQKQETPATSAPPAGPDAGAASRPWQRYLWLGVAAGLVVVYLLINLGIRNLFTGFTRVYVVQPILWCLVIAGVWAASRYGTVGKLKFTKAMLWMSLLLGLFQVAVSIIAAVFASFGNSPYVHTAYATFLSFCFWATALVGIEFGRAYLMSVAPKRYSAYWLVLISLLFVGFDLPLTRFTGVAGMMESVPFIAGSCIPSFTDNLLATFLAMMGGPVASIAYRVIPRAFEWFSPILPDLHWMLKGFLGLIVPFVSFMVLQGIYFAQPKAKVEAPKKVKKPVTKLGRAISIGSWVIVIGISAVIIIFALGGFGVRPGVVLTGSMSPQILAGDIVMVREVPFEQIAVGDVIQFESRGASIWHRVIEVQQRGVRKALITKGDANNGPDVDAVYAENYSGKVVWKIPKLGIITIKLRDLMSQAK